MALTGCCGCTSLRTGTLIIGWGMAVVHVLQTIGAAVLLGSADSVARSLCPDDPAYAAEIVRGVAGAAIGLFLFSLLCDAALLLGAASDRAGLLLPWLVWTGICLVLGSLVAVLQIWGAAALGHAGMIGGAVIVLLLYAVQWYWYTVVASHFRALQAARPAPDSVDSAAPLIAG